MFCLYEETRVLRKAEVAELADALGSGSSGGNSIRVQVPASAPENEPSRKSNRGFAGCFF